MQYYIVLHKKHRPSGVFCIVLQLHYMPNWFFIALIPPILWALGNLIDIFLVKKFLPKHTDNEHSLGSLIIVSCLVGLLFLPFIAFFNPQVFVISPVTALFLVTIGIIEGIAILLYLYALHHGDDASSVVTWFNSTPIFALILGFVFLSETISGKQFFAFGIILIGLLLVSIQKKELGIILKKQVALFMLIASFGYALTTVLFKIGAIQESFWIASFWQYVGLTILGIFFFVFIKPYRESFLTMFQNKKFSFYSINAINEGLFVAGTMIANFAAILGPVAIVSLLGSFQPVWVIVLGSVAALMYPKYFDNELALPKKELFIKLFGIFLTLIGVWFL
jgi:uncharacterized membrane protein